MNKADPVKIGWCDYTSNPIRCRCRHGCSYCYMRPFYRRFPDRWPVRPEWYARAFDGIQKKRPRRIWFGSATDMFGDWVPFTMIRGVLNEAQRHPQHTYFFLTKNPRRYGEFTFPREAWLGITIEKENETTENRALDFCLHTDRGRGFVSVEPLLGDVEYLIRSIGPDWLIIGADSRIGAKAPYSCWVLPLLEYADTKGLPVFIKHNLRRWYPDAPWANRREFPDALIRHLIDGENAHAPKTTFARE